MLQTGAGAAYFFKKHRGAQVASTTLMSPMSKAFVDSIYDFADLEDLDLVRLVKGDRKDDIARDRLKQLTDSEGSST